MAAGDAAELVHFVAVGRLTVKAAAPDMFDDNANAIVVTYAAPGIDSAAAKRYREWFANILLKAGKPLRERKRLAVDSGDESVPLGLHCLAEWHGDTETHLIVYYAVVTARFKLAASATEFLAEVRDALSPLAPGLAEARAGGSCHRDAQQPLGTLVMRYNELVRAAAGGSGAGGPTAAGAISALQQLEMVQRENAARLHATRVANAQANASAGTVTSTDPNAPAPQVLNISATPDAAGAGGTDAGAVGVSVADVVPQYDMAGTQQKAKRRKRLLVCTVVSAVVVVAIIILGVVLGTTRSA